MSAFERRTITIDRADQRSVFRGHLAQSRNVFILLGAEVHRNRMGDLCSRVQPHEHGARITRMGVDSRPDLAPAHWNAVFSPIGVATFLKAWTDENTSTL